MTESRHRPFWTHLPGRAETAKVAALALGVGLVGGVVFSVWPGLDLAVSRHFVERGGEFAFAQSDFWRTLRRAFLNGFTVWYVVVGVACLASYQGRRVLGLDFRKWLYLAACSLAGPLLLVNVLLKEFWGRWRPHEVIEFGGGEIFTRPLDTGGSCLDNCSFVSGEVASMVMAFIALAFVSRAWRPIFYGLSVLMGALAALIRIGQGGHFLSDTLFAGAFMVLIAAGLYWMFFLRQRGEAPPTERDSAAGAARQEALWRAISGRGLALLDRIFPRVK